MKITEFLSEYRISLNEQQLQAVQAVDGPVLLLAVPGSGKTTVLVTRLGYMIFCRNIPPEKILTVTYTRAAAMDMKERFGRLFGEEMKNRLRFSTINAICLAILNHYGRMTGRKLFSMVTDRRQSAMVTEVYCEICHEYPTDSDRQNVLSQITYIKNSMLGEEEIRLLDTKSDLPMSKIYPRYCRMLREKGLMDFDDQLVYAHRLLKADVSLCRYFREQFSYICVDEAQDTSRIQHEIIALLAGKEDNLFMVGDEDQSIYGFRAAYPQALLDFEKNHPGAKVLLMEENFRSNAAIVTAADRLIGNNTKRHAKRMKAFHPQDAPVRRITIHSRRDQYTLLAAEAKECSTETAVLYREHESVLPLMDLLEREQIPYRMRGTDMAFFTHRVVLDIVSMLRFAQHPDDEELFLKIYGKMGLFLRKEDAHRACRTAQQREIPILEAAIREGDLPAFTVSNLQNKEAILRRIARMEPEAAITSVLGELEYGNYLTQNRIPDGSVYVLRSLALREHTIDGFLERLTELQQLAANHRDDPHCPFILSTIHASKGLEYERVFLLDVIDNIFPESASDTEVLKALARIHKLDPNQEASLESAEEERRIFYVAVTRAKKELILMELPGRNLFIRELMGETGSLTLRGTTADTWNNGKRAIPSRKMASDMVPAWNTRRPSGNGASGSTSSASRNRNARPDSPELTDQAFTAFVDALGEGVLVEHTRFGKGVVVSMDDHSVTVDFDGTCHKLNLHILFEKHLLMLI